jgi:hypothetical protein
MDDGGIARVHPTTNETLAQWLPDDFTKRLAIVGHFVASVIDDAEVPRGLLVRKPEVSVDESLTAAIKPSRAAGKFHWSQWNFHSTRLMLGR